MIHTNRTLIALVLTAMILSACQPIQPAAPRQEPVPAPAAETSAPSLSDATVNEIETLVEKTMTENEIPGYALGIVMDGRIVYTKGFGVEQVGTSRSVTPHTVFGTGSVGKTATATAIMQLTEQGKIDLGAPVTDYLPYFKLADERYKDITVYHLITHRSGLPADPEDYFPLPVEYDDGVLERYVRGMDKAELLFAPGEQFSYSSIGFIVLGAIVAEISGQTFEDYLQTHVVGPLGMDDTVLIVRAADQAHIASPHVRNASGEVAVTARFPYRRQFAPAGTLYSSITDMARYAAAHLNRGEFEGARILDPTTYDAMWTRISDHHLQLGPVLTPLFGDFGMSWETGEIDGHRIVQHFGSDEGYSALLLLAPDDNVALVMSSNYFDDVDFNPSAWETATEVMRMILEQGQ